jgi:hypothetical protein
MHPLTEFRLRNGKMTQPVFAKLIDWSLSSLKKVELGQMQAGDRLVVSLAKALNKTVEEAETLVSGEPTNGNNSKGLPNTRRISRGSPKGNDSGRDRKTRGRRVQSSVGLAS